MYLHLPAHTELRIMLQVDDAAVKKNLGRTKKGDEAWNIYFCIRNIFCFFWSEKSLILL